MMSKLDVCALGVCLTSCALFGQSRDWWRLMQQGLALERSGRFSEAAAAYRDAVREDDTAGRRGRPFVAATNSLSLVYEQMGRFADALYWSSRALAMLDELDTAEPADRGTLLVNQALIRREQGQIAKADDLLREAIAMEAKVLPQYDPNLMLARAAWAELVLLEQRYAEGEQLIQQLLVALECQPLRWRREIGTLLGDLALVREAQGHPQDASRLLEDALGILEADAVAEAPILLRPLVNLARIQASAGDAQAADSNFRKAVGIAARLGSDHPLWSEVLNRYAIFLRHNGRKNEARLVEAKSKAALQASRRRGSGMTVDASSFRPR